jgi:hypothetical protein
MHAVGVLIGLRLRKARFLHRLPLPRSLSCVTQQFLSFDPLTYEQHFNAPQNLIRLPF